MPATITPLRRPTKLRSASDAQSSPASAGLGRAVPSRLHFWRGARGKTLLASVYGLVECPPLPRSVALIVSCDAHARREVRGVLDLDGEHPTLNLARVRQKGAALGGNEVHLLAGCHAPEARRVLARDLALANRSPLIAAS